MAINPPQAQPQQPAVPTLSACEAARAVLAEVGPPHRDAEEQALVSLITLSGVSTMKTLAIVPRHLEMSCW